VFEPEGKAPIPVLLPFGAGNRTAELNLSRNRPTSSQSTVALVLGPTWIRGNCGCRRDERALNSQPAVCGGLAGTAI
jgi:hypothetical protein